MSRASASRRFVDTQSGREAPREIPEKAREIIAVCLAGAAVFCLLATMTYHYGNPDGVAEPVLANLCGQVGKKVAWAFLFLIGKASFLLFAFLLYFGLVLFMRRELRSVPQKVVGIVVLCCATAITLAMLRGPETTSHAAPLGVGGVLGEFLAPKLGESYGRWGTGILLTVLLVVSFLMATDWLLYTTVRNLVERLARKRRGLAEETGEAGAEATPRKRRAKLAPKEKDAKTEKDEKDPEAALQEPLPTIELAPRGKKDVAKEDAAKEDPAAQAPPADAADAAAPPPARKEKQREFVIHHVKPKAPAKKPAREEPGTYSFPPIELFDIPRVASESASRVVVEANAKAIEQRLESFKIGSRVVAVSPGPAVTQYELELDEGIQMRRVVTFEPDLAAALRAISVRVVAPIPGKDTVGIEVPNARRQMVLLRELLEIQGVGKADQAIPICLGKDVAGAPLIEDLAQMPHLLIAGTTGSGKSVCINSILLSVLMTKTPEQVKLILIDPKMVELQLFKAIPHLLCPVVTNMKKAPGVLEWCVGKMEERYDLFSKSGVNHIKNYNDLGEKKLKERLGAAYDEQATPLHLPYIVIIVDELADLISVAQQEVEGSIQRLAQKSRAVGIHVILATQSPRREVITGIIKANLPCKIGFKVSNKLDSRVILDSNGAEKLLGHGDLLYIPPGTHRMVRAQGTFVSEREIRAVVDHLEKHASPPRFAADLLSPAHDGGKSPSEEDDLYDDAVKVVLGQQRGSATLLQRALEIGYTRASRLLELMERDNLVGPFVGSKSREVYLTFEQWESEKAASVEAARLAAEAEAGGGADGSGASPAEEESVEERVEEG